MPEAEFGGTRTFWQHWGSGPRRAVAIHAGLGRSGHWDGVARALGGVLRIEAFDLPGHGASGGHDPGRDIMDQIVAMGLDLIGDGPVDLLGHSFGGVAALRIAVEAPERVRSLVLYEPVFFAAAAGKAASFPPLAALEAAFARGDHAEAARAFIALWGGGPPWEALSGSRRAALAARMPLISAADPALHADRAGLLAPGRLERAAMPVLLLEGSASPPVVPAIAEALALRLPDVRRETIEGAAHMGPLSHPEPVAAAIRRHLGP